MTSEFASLTAEQTRNAELTSANEQLKAELEQLKAISNSAPSDTAVADDLDEQHAPHDDPTAVVREKYRQRIEELEQRLAALQSTSAHFFILTKLRRAITILLLEL